MADTGSGSTGGGKKPERDRGAEQAGTAEKEWPAP